MTGGAGFIGGNFVHALVEDGAAKVVNLDALTYAGSLETLAPVMDDPKHVFIHGNIIDRALLDMIFAGHKPDAVINFAAESHVDRSIESPRSFVETNVVGAFELLDAARVYYQKLSRAKRERFRFVHVSTDEVYGSLGDTGCFTEETPYAPSSPYAASKAASDHLVRAYNRTYGLPAIITNCSNNYGPYQYPEKLIPLLIHKATAGEPLPIYGDGKQKRDWLYVADHVAALRLVLEKGRAGEVYNIGAHNEMTNIDVARMICALLDELAPDSPHRPHESLISFVEDRPGHDRRYAIDATKIKRELGWSPRETFETGLEKTVRWYLENREWSRKVMEGVYDGERLGRIENKMTSEGR